MVLIQRPMGNISNLIIVDDPAQVLFLSKSLRSESSVKIVPLTAHALWALEHFSLPHEPVCAFAETYELAIEYEKCYQQLFLLLKEIEIYIGEQCSEYKFSGPGFLSGQCYYIGYSLSAIAKRFLLMQKVIETCSPDKVTCFVGGVDPWFSGKGYAVDPWISMIKEFLNSMSIPFELLQCPAAAPKYKGNDLFKKYSRYVRLLSQPAGINKLSSMIDGRINGSLRLLLIDQISFDWEPVLSDLRRLKRGASFSLRRTTLDQREWTDYYQSYFWLNNSRIRKPLNIGPPRINAEEAQHLRNIFDDWLKYRNQYPDITIGGHNFFPSLVPEISSMVSLGPALVRHTDEVAMRALEMTKPDAVCFFAIARLSEKRLAHVCKKYDIPVISYQHGFGYSVQIATKDEETDQSHADYFLTYGPKIRPRADSPFPAKAKYVAVGSARIERMLKKRRVPAFKRNSGKFRILWIAESSTRNTLVSSLTEDTKRYLTQKTCLSLLGRSKRFNIVYRPLQHCLEYDGITAWLKDVNMPHLTIDAVQPLETLIKSSDIVIIDISSPTTWAEVLALRTPMILYCNPDQTLLTSEFMIDLDRACCWCKTHEDLISKVSALVDNPDDFIREKGMIDPSAFVSQYILHEGNCPSRVISFLEELQKNKRMSSPDAIGS
jgi:hypothetical protein